MKTQQQTTMSFKQKLIRFFFEGRIKRSLWAFVFMYFLTFMLSGLGILGSNDFTPVFGLLFFASPIIVYAMQGCKATSFVGRKILEPQIGETVRYLYITVLGDQVHHSYKHAQFGHKVYEKRPILAGEAVSVRATIKDIVGDQFKLELSRRWHNFPTEKKGWFIFKNNTYTLGELVMGNPIYIIADREDILVA